MPTITMETNVQNEYNEKMKEFNEFLRLNMDFIKQITPMNPTITEDDEWRTDDYSKYDEIRKNVK